MRTKLFVPRMLRVRQSRSPSYLSDEQLKLYTLIWKRFIASQMVPAVYDITTAKIEAKSFVDRKTYEFRLKWIGPAL